jgi:RimJ/RimL family protein N-acetyltransferase
MAGMHLETARLLIRTFVPDDAPAIHCVLDRAFGDGSRAADPAALDERRSWVEWNILNGRWHAALGHPPYGELAVVRKEGQTLVGAVSYVPCLDRFGQLPGLGRPDQPSPVRATPEVGLFWAIDPPHQNHGYATEAARAPIEHAFDVLDLARLVATTEHDNAASQAVMRKLGMRLERNPLPTPPWLQTVGVLGHP